MILGSVLHKRVPPFQAKLKKSLLKKNKRDGGADDPSDPVLPFA